VADEIGAFAAPGDAASTDGVASLLTEATRLIGDIDVYCATPARSAASPSRQAKKTGEPGSS